VIIADASVLIAYLNPRDALHQHSAQLIGETAGWDLGASPLTVAEVLVYPARAGKLTEAQRELAEIEVEEMPFGPDLATRLATLRAQTGLRLPDCCVLLAAQDAEAERVLTFDDRLAEAAASLGF
jgi:predicted nucleic acid-binding protein